MSNFEIPMDSGNSNKIENVPLIPTGMNLCTLYGVSDLGTQSTKFGNKRQIKLLFEFPLEKRVFWEGDPERPSVVSTQETMTLASKGNLRKKWIEPMIGRKLGDEEGFDPTSLLGQNFIATVSHSPDGQWANIVGISPLDDKGMRMFDLQGPMAPVNTPFQYHINDGFDTEAFAKLPRNIRTKLMDSIEGETFSKSGGKFAEPQNQNHSHSHSTAPTAPGAMGTSGKKLVMKPDAPYTYDALKANNWTDDQIVEKGLATWQEATPPPQPAAAPAPSAPSAPSAPAPAPAPAPAQPKHPVVMKDPSDDIEEWLKSNWTYELLVQHGHATWVK